MRDFGSLILGKFCTFVCGTLFGRIKLIEPNPSNKVPHTKVQFLPSIRDPTSHNYKLYSGTVADFAESLSKFRITIVLV